MPTATVFGPFSPDLAAGAHNAIDVCLAIQPRERVALIADEPSREVAASLAAALDEAGASTETILLEQVARRPLGAAPSVVLEAGTHEQSVRLATADLLELTKAEVVDVCKEE